MISSFKAKKELLKISQEALVGKSEGFWERAGNDFRTMKGEMKKYQSKGQEIVSQLEGGNWEISMSAEDTIYARTLTIACSNLELDASANFKHIMYEASKGHIDLNKLKTLGQAMDGLNPEFEITAIGQIFGRGKIKAANPADFFPVCMVNSADKTFWETITRKDQEAKRHTRIAYCIHKDAAENKDFRGLIKVAMHFQPEQLKLPNKELKNAGAVVSAIKEIQSKYQQQMANMDGMNSKWSDFKRFVLTPDLAFKAGGGSLVSLGILFGTNLRTFETIVKQSLRVWNELYYAQDELFKCLKDKNAGSSEE